MTFFKKLLALFSSKPRETSAILDDMNERAAELRARAVLDQAKVDENIAEETRIREELEAKVKELEHKNCAHKACIAHANRVAERFDEFVA
ncbi:coil containing protein [Vibrio phage 1.081.O._10N.286.52.C2]|nr:coil containing protein [Vibrio phage 1.081.O._10N.286.52.C2]